MSDEQKKLDPPPDLIGDSIKLLHFGQMVIHAFAWPFRLLYTKPGTLGRQAFVRDCFIGLMFGVPILMQKLSSRLDGVICLRLWAGLWWWMVIHAVASWLLNRRNRPHRHEIVGKTWMGHFWPVCLIASASYFYLRPCMSGLGNLFTWGSLAYVLSNFVVELQMGYGPGRARDSEIEGRNFMYRMEE